MVWVEFELVNATESGFEISIFTGGGSIDRSRLVYKRWPMVDCDDIFDKKREW